MLLTAYHGRRTSGCYNSFVPPESRVLQALSARLPNPAALREASDMGFTTVVVHHPGEREVLERWLGRFDDMAARGLLRRVHGTESMTAFELPR